MKEGRDGPGKSERVVTFEVLKKKEKEIMTISPQQEHVVNKPETNVRFNLLSLGNPPLEIP